MHPNVGKLRMGVSQDLKSGW